MTTTLEHKKVTININYISKTYKQSHFLFWVSGPLNRTVLYIDFFNDPPPMSFSTTRAPSCPSCPRSPPSPDDSDTLAHHNLWDQSRSAGEEAVAKFIEETQCVRSTRRRVPPEVTARTKIEGRSPAEASPTPPPPASSTLKAFYHNPLYLD
jgi:hypothetical protein